MVTQKIVTRLSNDVLPPVRMVSGDVGREIQLEIYANDESLAPIDLETYSARITIIKPDKTFVIQDFDNDKVELPEQAGAVTGHGYYQIKIYTAGDHQIYTGQGPFIVDDDVLSEEMIESVAEVNGYEFPDDFLTDTDLREYVTKYELEDALAGIIDDDTTDYNSTWSSAKISEALSSVTKTATGNPIEFTDGADAPLVKCTTAIQGNQDLHGYDKPWVGGSGKNKLPVTVDGIKSVNRSGTWSGNAYTLYGVTFTILTDSAENVIGIKVHGLANETVDFIPTNGYFTLPANSYILNGCSNGSSSTYRLNLYKVVSDGNYLITQSLNGDSPSFTLSGDENLHSHMYISQGVQVDTVIYPMIRISTEIDPTFEPYSNICPITAYTEGEIEVSDGDGNTTTHTATFSNSIYQGNADFVRESATSNYKIVDLGDFTYYEASTNVYASNSVLSDCLMPSSNDQVADCLCSAFEVVARNNISIGKIAINTNGRIIVALNTSDLISDLTGVQFVYRLATPTTETITPTNLPIKSLFGYNHIASSTGEMEVVYIKQTYDAIMEATKLDNMKVYSTAEQVVGKWIDGRDVYEKTIVSEFTNHAENYTLDLSQMGGNAILPIDISPAVCIFTEGGSTYKQIVQPTATNQNINSISVYHGGATADTFKGYVTVRYIYL